MKQNWVLPVLIAVVFAGGGFWGGMSYAQSEATSARAAFAGAAGRAGFAGRTGAAGGATFGTILSIDPTSITIQLPASTSSAATTGTKIVLYDASTQIQALQSVPASSLAVGQTVTVAGTANSDGSVTATMIQVRPAGAGRPAGVSAPATGQ